MKHVLSATTVRTFPAIVAYDAPWRYMPYATPLLKGFMRAALHFTMAPARRLPCVFASRDFVPAPRSCVCVSASRSAPCRLLPHTKTTYAMRAHSPVLRTAPTSLLLPKTRREDHAAQSEGSSIYRPLKVRVHCALHATHAEERAGNVIHCQPMSNPAATTRSTSKPCQTMRRRQAPLSTHIEPSGCTAPICVRRPSSTSVPSLLSGPFRASRGRSPGATVAPPPGDGMDSADRHLPAGAAQGGPRRGPESARLSYNGFILGTILVSIFPSNLHTVLAKVSKWGPQKLSKGRGIVAPTIPQQSPPTIPPKAYLK